MTSDGVLLFVNLIGLIAAATLLVLIILWHEEPEEPEEHKEPEYHIDATLIYDVETIYRNCTVQVLENSVTGDISVGFWQEVLDEL